MQYNLFLDLDQNYGIQFFNDDGTEGATLFEHPKTKLKMDRNTALELAESISNPKPPKTKLELFERMTDEDYGNYLEAVSVVKGRFDNLAILGDEEKARVKAQNILFTKFELRPDFEFSDTDIQTLATICKDFNLSIITTL